MSAGKEEPNGVDFKAGAQGANVDDPSRRVSVSHATFRCRRGYDLYTTTFTPAVRRGRACLVFHHGLSDHSERHSAVLSHLCSSLGMTAYTYDAHGHGRSGPPGSEGRALILCFDDMVDDVLDFTRQFVVPAEEATPEAEAGPPGAVEGQQGAAAGQGRPPLRIFLMGYSMGALACLLAAADTTVAPPSSSSPPASSAPCSSNPPAKAGQQQQHGGGGGAGANGSVVQASAGAGAAVAAAGGGGGGGSLYSGLLLTSGLTDPLYGSHPVLRAIKMSYVTLLSWVLPAMPMFKRNPVEAGIRDPTALAQMSEDMLWYRGNFKVATVASLLWGCQRLRSTARNLAPMPMYVQHAAVDVACSLASMRALLARARPTDLTMHVVEGAYHDLHHDPETPVLLGHMAAWLGKRA